MNLTGHVVDRDSKDPLPGATVELWYDNLMLSRSAADNNGYFSISSASSPDNIVITNASYKKATFPYMDSLRLTVFPVERNIVEGEAVIVKNKLKGNTVRIVAGLVFLLLLLSKKRT